MNLQNIAPPRSTTNGFNRRKGEKETGIKFDNKSHTGKSNFNKFTSTGLPTGNKGGVDSSSRDRLLYLTTCLIGHQVEVHVIDGSVFSGIFHATNAENDFGIILKMATVTNTGSNSSQGLKNILDSVNKTPSKTLIIPAKDLVQVVAKGVPITRDGLTNEIQVEKQQELMTDSFISRSKHVDLERELEPWVPDDDNIECPELDNTFDRHWNRGWDQFETNAALFGVKSTFNEELYTTKLDRGPNMRELEKQALRLAREIEGEDTQDLHLAEERGIHFHSSFDLDEETKYSSVFRGVDDSGYDESEDIWDTENSQTFGDVTDPIIKSQLSDLKSGKSSGSQLPSTFPSLVEAQSSQTSTTPIEDSGKHTLLEQNQSSKTDESGVRGKKERESSDKSLSADATAYAPSSSDEGIIVKTHEAPDASTSSTTSESGNPPATAPALSRTSSMASEKSTLNPNAKEFRLNPNAKSFVPFPVRPPSPVAEPSFYYPPSMQPMPMGASFAPQQPLMFQPQQGYFHPNMPQYGQQMLLGQPRQMVYMPTYPPEMPYKGRDY